MIESRGALSYIDIFVDDFLGITQGNKARREEVKRALFHSLDDVLRPPLSDGPEHAQRTCITEKYEAGRHHMGNAKKSIGVGY